MTSPTGSRFDRLIAPHFDALYRAAYRLTGNAPDAEDLVQEVCLRACPKLPELEDLDSAKGWLLRVQYRVFVDGARRRRRSPLTPMSGEVEASEHMISAAPGPDEEADALLSNGPLERAWAQLERNQQALLALHAEGYSLAELHEITGLAKTVLTARLHRARTRLAKLLGRHAAGQAIGSTGELT
ncbi:MAG: sigma-70 family RNA polymerase sigma factor [Gammaproteobacteria bacterium]|nr:sigma-70 family RNA polymerase sigma factor [Gammaproteobacteria bacterium]